MSVGWVAVLLVAAGGAAGGMARLAASRLLARWLGTGFPWGTLAVNLSGALLAGWIAGRLGVPQGLDLSSAWLGLMVGVLGGYTTVSSLSLQTLALWQSGRTLIALANVGTTCLSGLALAWLGWWLAGGAP
ncbi:fluoride efflux transporter FluC [Billgrantia montanilacus]|uniref:Fluoride-specific ion channel FluC n=1 Tax=Billgrantia montanilacus TaxID=2282305 RepID=A0A368TZZ6_9GAMM|nr:CrcB family protein [Halomonas montanilacus]RCV90439.1 CrcB family protein [Halomonas montanilacus]